MNFILCNISASNDSLLTRWLKIYVLKELAYSGVSEDKIRKINDYSMVLFPEHGFDPTNVTQDLLVKRYLKCFSDKFSIDSSINRSIVYSIGKYFEEALPSGVTLEEVCTHYFRIDIVGEISDSEIGIIYSDGSINNATGVGGYGIVKLIRSGSDTMIEDILTGKLHCFETYSGTVDDATNNIAELTGIQKAVELINDEHRYWVIIADSDLAIKSFRDYINEWRKNNYHKANSNKEISNKELIKKIDQLMLSKPEVILLKWTESHNKQECNEMCDALAKQACGVK